MAGRYDVIVIGAGPGGYVAAIRAAQLGLKAAVIEPEHLGGVCLNWGCIPTKALLRSAEIYRYLTHAGDYGLCASDPGYRLDEIVKRSRRAAARLNGGVRTLLGKNKVDLIWGNAALARPGEVIVSEAPSAQASAGALGVGTYLAGHVIIATGARPLSLPGIALDGKLIWSYEQALMPPSLPKSLLVIGAGAIGIEFASFYGLLGSQVTVVELRPQILPAEDAEVAARLRQALEKQGLRILTGARITSLKKGADSVRATVESDQGKQEITAERMICAVGVAGNTENIGLERCGVRLAGNAIATDGYGRTNVPGLYAIGDVAGPPMLAHKAAHEGIICVEAIAGKDVSPLDRDIIPSCTYCLPQVASVGLTEEQARQQGYDIKVGRFTFAGNGKAIAMGEPEGLVKTIFERASGRLLGAHMVGAEVTELIQGYVIAMSLETTEEALARTIFPHPTLSEVMHESTLDADEVAIHG